MKLSPFPNYFQNLKELLSLNISKINQTAMISRARHRDRLVFIVFFFIIQNMIFFEYIFVCLYVSFQNLNNKLFNCLSLSTILGVCRQ